MSNLLLTVKFILTAVHSLSPCYAKFASSVLSDINICLTSDCFSKVYAKNPVLKISTLCNITAPLWPYSVIVIYFCTFINVFQNYFTDFKVPFHTKV